MVDGTLPYSNGKMKSRSHGNGYRYFLQRLVTLGIIVAITRRFPPFRNPFLRNQGSDSSESADFPDDSIRFFSLGDWGVVYCEELYKTGKSSGGHRCTGDGQVEVANAMVRKFCQGRGGSIDQGS